MSLLNIFLKINTIFKQPSRNLYYWVNKQFNSVDFERKKEIGPDLSCAEWILRNGGSVKWKNGLKTTTDFNELPRDNPDFHLYEVDASDTYIMFEGFEHFRGCKYIHNLILHNCWYINDEALHGLEILKDSLTVLKVSRCKNVTDNGILNLQTLKKLQILSLNDLPGVKNIEGTVKTLQNNLPRCNINVNN